MGKLTVLGSGDAFASGGKYTTSFWIEASGMNVLLDCGATAFVRMKQLGLHPADLDLIIITHFHGDHYGGLPFVTISSKYEQPRDKPLTIVGPQGMREQLFRLQQAMYPGTEALLDELPFQIVEFSDQWLTLDQVSVKAFPVKHSPPSNPHGVQLRWSGKTLAFSGDTEWTDTLISLAKDTELMICECNDLEKSTPGHLSYQTIMAKQDQLKTRRLLLSHMGAEMLAAHDNQWERLQDGQVIDLW